MLDIYLLRDAMDRVQLIQSRLLTAHSCQKSYTNRNTTPLEFMVGDSVRLKISPMNGVMRFWKKGKLNPRFIGQFKILRRVGELAFELAFPTRLSAIHVVFDFSMLRQDIPDKSHVISYDLVELGSDLSYKEDLVAILDMQVRRLRTKDIPPVKV